MDKNQCNGLKIFKSEDGYKLEWLFDDQLLYSEKYLIGNQELNILEIIEHKKHCCLVINEEDFAIIEENFNSPMVIGINDSIENLRPGAVYEFSNKIFTYWEHNSLPPSWDEIILNMNRLQQEIT